MERGPSDLVGVAGAAPAGWGYDPVADWDKEPVGADGVCGVRQDMQCGRIRILLSVAAVIAAALWTTTGARTEQSIVGVTDAEVEACYAAWARRMNITVAKMDSALERAGRDTRAVRDYVREHIVRCKATSSDHCRC
jgi:hypothetical protein